MHPTKRKEASTDFFRYWLDGFMYLKLISV